MIGAGLVVNDWTALCGMSYILHIFLPLYIYTAQVYIHINDAHQPYLYTPHNIGMDTTATEISVVEGIFKLQGATASRITKDMKASLIDSLA